MKQDIVGYEIDTVVADDCVEEVAKHICEGEGMKWLACFNPHSYAIARKDALFSKALQSADWLVPDGVGVVIASKLKKGSVLERVTGSDVFSGLSQRLNKNRGCSCFFLGGTPETLSRIEQLYSKEFSHVEIVGTYSPPYKQNYTNDDLKKISKIINEVKPDVVWVGLGAPKQEKTIMKLAGQIDAKFIAAVGAVFDFYVGNITRSSPVYQKLGLEWLPRLIQEPKRLWRRMFVSAPIFIFFSLIDAARNMGRVCK